MSEVCIKIFGIIKCQAEVLMIANQFKKTEDNKNPSWVSLWDLSLGKSHQRGWIFRWTRLAKYSIPHGLTHDWLFFSYYSFILRNFIYCVMCPCEIGGSHEAFSHGRILSHMGKNGRNCILDVRKFLPDLVLYWIIFGSTKKIENVPPPSAPPPSQPFLFPFN